MFNVSTARFKALDTRKKVGLQQVSKALQIFYQEKGKMPGNYFGPTDEACDNDYGPVSRSAYERSMQEFSR